MKGNRNPPPPPAGAVPLSPNSKSTAKYTNKDGSKFITVPKMNTPVDSAQPSPTTASSPAAKPAAHAGPGIEPAQTVNRKKQKRRAKAAAKAAAEQAQSGPAVNGLPSPPRTNDQQSADADQEDDEEEPGAGHNSGNQPVYLNGVAQGGASGKSKKHKKKKKKNATGQGGEFPNDNQYTQADRDQSPTPIAPPPLPQHDRPGMSREKIWNTNSQEERERIKEFWLGLSETERKSLVKVEKDAVLKKMKEQQKHTCSCTVCGRKRTAIEEELEGLYDAYYEELEQYANHPNQGEGPPMLRPRRSFGSMGGMRPRGLHSRFSNHQPSRGRIVDELGEDEEEEEAEAEVEDDGEGDEEGEDVYSEEELEDDMYSEEEQEPSEELHRSDYAADFFNFGNSLTVQGGILTVADDLLKNDGKKFIEMMEQLAERRMAREEDARGQFERGYDHANGDRYGHNHPPPPDEEEFEDEEEEYEEDDEEEYDSQDEETQDTMTEEQRMEEGRRMFQIFAARMFEQRVLTAYREKVAKERQAKLLEEIEAENQQNELRKAKKAKDAQRRKDKAAKKKEAQAQEKARREAEKAAEEEARRAAEARKAEEQRAKAERENQKKKDAKLKAEAEERQRKEADRLRKEENERKAREAREREKKARDEARLKEKAREQKERKDREMREQQERERREKEAKAKAEREAKDAKEAKEAKEGKDTKEKRKKEERAAHKAAALAAAIPVPVTLPKRSATQQPPAPPVAAVPVLPQQSTSYASPKVPVATPALPKAPTPMRVRQTSQQDGSAASSGAASNSGSMASQNPSPHPVTPVHVSAGLMAPPSKSGAVGIGSQGSALPPSHSASPMSFTDKLLPPQHSLFGIPPMGGAMSFPPGLSQAPPPPGFGNALHRDPLFPPMPGFRPAPGMMPMPPGFGGPGGNRGYPMPPPGFHGPLESPVPSIAQMMTPGLQKDTQSPHSRQNSGSFDPGASQPISRPTPIGRPASIVQGQRSLNGSPSDGPPKPEPEAHLGSRALLDDLDDGSHGFLGRLSRGASAPGPRPAPGFPMPPFGMDPMFSHNPWGPPGAVQPNLFGPLPPFPPPGFNHSPLNAHGPMSMPWGHAMPSASTFGSPGGVDRPIEPRSVAVRKMLRRACEELANAESRNAEGNAEASDTFIPLERIKTQVEILNHGYAVDEKELLDICETEGNEVNGGGSFDVVNDGQGRKSIRFVSGNERPTPQPVQLAVGYHPGSPVGGGR